MDELVPVILGIISGGGLLVAGAAATIVSGEYLQGWVYLLLDFGEEAFGLVIGYLFAAKLLTPDRRAKLVAAGRTTPAKTER